MRIHTTPRILMVFLLLSFSMIWAGCPDEDGKKNTAKSDNGIWLTYEGETHAMTLAVQTVNNVLFEDALHMTMVASGLNQNAKDLDAKSDASDLQKSTNLVTLRLMLGLEKDQKLTGASFTITDDDYNSNLVVDGGVGGLPKGLISKNATLTIDALEYGDKDVFKSGDEPLELTSNMKVQTIVFHFEGDFVEKSDKDGDVYKLSGKASYTKKK